MPERHIRVQGRAEIKAPADQVVIAFTIASRNRHYHNAANDLAERTRVLRAEAMAAAAEVTLGPLIGMEYGWHELRINSRTHFLAAPRDFYCAMDVSPEDVAFEDSVTVTWEIG